MTDNVVEPRKATKLYAGVPAIKDVDLQLRRGEIHALVGENGAGKSTLTKALSGVVTLTSGQLFINGEEVSPRTPLEARQLGVAMVFQENSLVPTMTVAPMAMAATRSPPPTMSQRIGLSLTEALTLKEALPFAVIGLDHCQGRMPGAISRCPDPAHDYDGQMEVRLGSWVNGDLTGPLARS